LHYHFPSYCQVGTALVIGRSFIKIGSALESLCPFASEDFSPQVRLGSGRSLSCSDILTALRPSPGGILTFQIPNWMDVHSQTTANPKCPSKFVIGPIRQRSAHNVHSPCIIADNSKSLPNRTAHSKIRKVILIRSMNTFQNLGLLTISQFSLIHAFAVDIRPRPGHDRNMGDRPCLK
jgi:hypothetical protein